jgi:site-specific DNA recombinase
LRAAAYVRFSSDQQDGSDEQQAEEIAKLAEREGYRLIGEPFTDEAISGDTGREARPGLAALLDAAEAGAFDVLLAWDTSRIGRQDSVDGAEILGTLKRAGITIHTCRDGKLDPRESMDRLRYAFSAEGNHTENRRRAYNTTRGLIKNARAGNRNGARSPFGFRRAQFTPEGKLVRRLQPGQRKDNPDHVVRLVPSENADEVAAVRFAFERFGSADIGLRALCAELEAKGFPSPTGRGWHHRALRAILTRPEYRGCSRYGATPGNGKYHAVQGDEIVPVNGRRLAADAIVVNGGDGLVDGKLFDQVQRRLRRRSNHHAAARSDFPLSGLVYCAHCGRPMTGRTVRRRKRGKAYTYIWYICPSYTEKGTRSGCGHYRVDAGKLLGYLVAKLQEVLLGPGRDELTREIRRELEARHNGTGGDAKRLQSRLVALDAEVRNLVRLARTAPDVDEIAGELAQARSERESIKAELSRVGRVVDVEAEARAAVDRLWNLGRRLGKADPLELRTLLRQAVGRIVCQFQKGDRTASGRVRCSFVKGSIGLLPELSYGGALASR